MYDSLAYPHSMHRRYVRGCVQCLERSRAGARRLSESRRRAAEHRRAQSEAYAARKTNPNPGDTTP